MKTHFPEFFPPSETDFKDFWSRGIISLDANVLLNAYRYTEETQKKLFEILDKIGDRLWLSNQAAFEFLSNRRNVILGQKSQFANLEKYADSMKKHAKDGISKNLNFRYHPTIDKEEIFGAIELTLDEIAEKAKKLSDEYPHSLEEDSVLEYYLARFEGKVGEPFEQQELDAVIKEGKQRFSKEIPPGYEDNLKPEETRYGDLILWKQLINKGKEMNLPILFVTDDDKEDWWRIVKRQTLGQREELTKEMRVEGGVPFYMYSVHRFLKYAKEYLEVDVSESQIDEAENMRDDNSDIAPERPKVSLLDVAMGKYTMLEALQHNYSLFAPPPTPTEGDLAIYKQLQQEGFIDEMTKQLNDASKAIEREAIARRILNLPDVGEETSGTTETESE